MKTETNERHVIDLEERIDFRKIELEEGYILRRKDGIEEVITELNYTESEKISRVDTLRRNKKVIIESKKVIIESGYDIDTNTGELTEFFAGRHYKKDTEKDNFIHKASKKYFELNFILEEDGL